MGVSATPRAKEKWLATVRRLPQIRLEANRNRIEIRSNHIREEYERDEGTTHNTQTRSKRSLSKNNNTLNYRVLTELEDDASINTTTTSLSKFKIRVLESGVIAPELGIVMEQTGSYMEYSGYIYVPIIYHMPHLAESGLVGKGETCNTTANWEHQNLIVQLLKEKIGTLIPQNHKRRSKRFIKAISRRGHQFSFRILGQNSIVPRVHYATCTCLWWDCSAESPNGKRNVQQKRPVQSGRTRENNLQTLRNNTKPYDLEAALIHRAATRTRPLQSTDWNGHIEMTDECNLGLALFQVNTHNFVNKEIHMKFKDGIRSKRVEIHRVLDYSTVETYLFRKSHRITIPDLMLKYMGDQGVEQYLSEYTLTSQLLDKIDRIDAELEVPLIGPSFEIQGGYTMKPRTLGQWFLMLLLERVRRRVSEGVGLRTLLYCVCWWSRLVLEHDYERLRASATMIKAWLLQNTCQDCAYKFLRELRADVAFEYYFNIADSFSENITLPDLKPSIKIGTCGEDRVVPNNNPGVIKTFGQHSFLTSPFANTCLPVSVKLVENELPRVFHMTGRQTATLLTMLDLHARVLRAQDWKQCRRAFSACLRERRANNGDTLLAVMCQIVEDLVALARLSPALSTSVGHFALLIFQGTLSVEMIQAYNLARDNTNLSAHTFIVRHCFLRAPTPDTQAYADVMYDRFINLD
ncbi:unnamed protein product, partial [Brenthis ino]